MANSVLAYQVHRRNYHGAAPSGTAVVRTIRPFLVRAWRMELSGQKASSRDCSTRLLRTTEWHVRASLVNTCLSVCMHAACAKFAMSRGCWCPAGVRGLTTSPGIVHQKPAAWNIKTTAIIYQPCIGPRATHDGRMNCRRAKPGTPRGL